MIDTTAPDTSDLRATLIDRAADIVAAYVGHNTVAHSEIASLIGTVHAALTTLGATDEPAPAPEPAVPVRRSVKPDHVVCLDCGRKFRSLKRHLRTHHDTTPVSYREKWGLGADYPMVAPDYAAERSKLAKKLGLGQKPRGRAA